MDRLTMRGVLHSSQVLPFDGLWLADLPQAGVQVWAGSSAGSGLETLTLAGGAAVRRDASFWLGGTETPFVIAGLLQVNTGGQSLLLLSDAITGGVVVQRVSATGTLSQAGLLEDSSGRPAELSEMAAVTLAGQTYLAAVAADRDGLSLYQFIPGTLRLQTVETVTDTAKTTLNGISSLLNLHRGGTEFLITASTAENGLSCYAVTAGGGLELRDTLGPKDGLWIAGLEDIATLTVAGQSYVLGVSAQSSTLSVIRVNPVGAMFLTDMAWDTRETRFAGALALDVFEAGGRSFVVTGGRDDGVSLFELLPGGQLLHHESLGQGAGWAVGHVSDIQATVTGNEVQILMAGAQGGLAQLILPLGNLGQRLSGGAGNDVLTGGALDDVVSGGAGNDSLSGGAGEDVIIAGTGRDTLTGGDGADVFVFTADGGADMITDFRIGQDRINLDDWGMVYDISSLTIRGNALGAAISWQEEVIYVRSHDGTRLDLPLWGQDDFIF